MEKFLSLPGKRRLEFASHPVIMGIVNLTPDSFFAESRVADPEAAAARALELQESGAGILDFGAESTRPGSEEIDAPTEKARLIPALKAFRRLSNAIVSVDTRHAETAEAAMAEGADIINDISALADPAMAAVAARSGAGLVLMHMQGTPRTMQAQPRYGDCAAEVRDFLLEAARRAESEGIPRTAIALDPGIGFGKALEHNLDLIARLHLIADTGYPVLVGLSRKRFVGQLTGRDTQDRLSGSLGAACAAWLGGARIFRVHDVAATRDALEVFIASLGTPPKSSLARKVN